MKGLKAVIWKDKYSLRGLNNIEEYVHDDINILTLWII